MRREATESTFHVCDDEQSRESQLGDARACTLASCLDFNADAAFHRFYTARQARAFGFDAIVRERKKLYKGCNRCWQQHGPRMDGETDCSAKCLRSSDCERLERALRYSKFSMAVFEFYRDAVVKAQQQ